MRRFITLSRIDGVDQDGKFILGTWRLYYDDLKDEPSVEVGGLSPSRLVMWLARKLGR